MYLIGSYFILCWSIRVIAFNGNQNELELTKLTVAGDWTQASDVNMTCTLLCFSFFFFWPFHCIISMWDKWPITIIVQNLLYKINVIKATISIYYTDYLTQKYVFYTCALTLACLSWQWIVMMVYLACNTVNYFATRLWFWSTLWLLVTRHIL